MNICIYGHFVEIYDVCVINFFPRISLIRKSNRDTHSQPFVYGLGPLSRAVGELIYQCIIHLRFLRTETISQ